MNVHKYFFPTDESNLEKYLEEQNLQWTNVDLNNPQQLKQLHRLFIGESAALDRLGGLRTYTVRFLRWVLQQPGSRPEWLVGIEEKSTGAILAFVAAVQRSMKMKGEVKDIAEIPLLRFHEVLVGGNINVVLFEEIMRRVKSVADLEILHYADFCGANRLFNYLARANSHNRYLIPEKVRIYEQCFDNGDLMLDPQYVPKLPNKVYINGFRKMTDADIPQAHKLLSDYLNKFSFAPVYTLETFTYWFRCRPQLIQSFVVANGGTITDFISYFITQIEDPKQKVKLQIANLSYVVATNSVLDLVNSALVTANTRHYDMVHAYDIMDNSNFLEECDFLEDFDVEHLYTSKKYGNVQQKYMAFFPF